MLTLPHRPDARPAHCPVRDGDPRDRMDRREVHDCLAGATPLSDVYAVGFGRRRARTASDAVGADTAYGSYDALVADPDVDIVYIATPQLPPRARTARDGRRQACAHREADRGERAEAQDIANHAAAAGSFLHGGVLDALPAQVRRARATPAGPGRRRPCSPTWASTSRRITVFDPALAGGPLFDMGTYPLSIAICGRSVTDLGHGIRRTRAQWHQRQLAIAMQGERGGVGRCIRRSSVRPDDGDLRRPQSHGGRRRAVLPAGRLHAHHARWRRLRYDEAEGGTRRAALPGCRRRVVRNRRRDRLAHPPPGRLDPPAARDGHHPCQVGIPDSARGQGYSQRHSHDQCAGIVISMVRASSDASPSNSTRCAGSTSIRIRPPRERAMASGRRRPLRGQRPYGTDPWASPEGQTTTVSKMPSSMRRIREERQPGLRGCRSCRRRPCGHWQRRCARCRW